MDHDVFISYAIENKRTADAICNALEQDKIECWIAPRNVSGGISYARQINKAIKHSTVLVLVFSKFAQNSRDVGREIFLAFKNDKAILSFNIDGTEPQDEIEYYIGPNHWIDAHLNPEKEFKKLIKDISKLILPERKEFIHRPSKIFISFSLEDKDKVLKIANSFKALQGIRGKGTDFFIDSKVGDFHEKIVEELIYMSDLFILCWSNNAKESEYVKQEYTIALKRLDLDPSFEFFPIIIDETTDIPPELMNFNFKKFY
ncbi:MAG: toll/interleukin-1 receptor domain-containing protein [Methanobrevibacter sp.]|nr:toll/interleukin-1 receptor domain-containing protein [Methanobrevibacter sp.]